MIYDVLVSAYILSLDSLDTSKQWVVISILVSGAVLSILGLIVCVGGSHLKCCCSRSTMEIISFSRYGVLDHRSKSSGIHIYLTWFTISRFTYLLMLLVMLSMPAWSVVAVLGVLLVASCLVHTLLRIFSTYY